MTAPLKPLMTLGAFASLLPLPVPVDAQVQLERVEVTGSNVLRTDTETVTPVEIITREDIERSGKPTVADVLRFLPANTGGNFDESFSNSAPGSAGISLRGLGPKYTLVLLNGRRVAGYGFAQNIVDTFVDLNSFPASAVDRIEIVKDGASAIYGSDAVGGVINIILRRDFRGAEGAALAGYFDGKHEYGVNLAVGSGDLRTDKFNFFGLLDYYRREELLQSDTEYLATRDLRRYQGGRNFQSVTGGGFWSDVTGFANGRPILGSQRRAISDCNRHGRVVTSPEAIELGFSNVVTPRLNVPGNTWCLVDFNKSLSALPGTQRIGALVRGTLDLGPRLQAYGELGLSRVETEQTFTPPFFANAAVDFPAAYVYNLTFAPGVAGNPFATNARFTGNLFALGTRDSEITSDSTRALVGAKYAVGAWEFDSALVHSRNNTVWQSFRRMLVSDVNAVFNVPNAVQPPEPVSNASSCNLDLQYSSAGCRDLLADLRREATSELTLVDAKANTLLGQLPGGPIGLALGVEYRTESIDQHEARAATEAVLGSSFTASAGRRSVVAGFIEAALPFTRTVEAQVAARNEYYSDFGNALVPKLGLKVKPSRELLLRATWGRGFRAPTLPELYIVTSTGTSIIDPFNGQVVQTRITIAGNPDLEPERSRNTLVGFVLAPGPDFSFSIDYYDISQTDFVFFEDPQVVVNNDFASRQAGGAGDPRVIRDPATNQVVNVSITFNNVTTLKTSGFDIDLRGAVRSTVGRFSARLNAAYVTKYEWRGIDHVGSNSSFFTLPRFRGALDLAWERGPVVAGGKVVYIHRYDQEFAPQSFFTPQDPKFQTGTLPRKVAAYTTLDLFLRVAATPHLTLSAWIINVTEETPPYDPSLTNNLISEQADIRGRIYRLGLKYRF